MMDKLIYMILEVKKVFIHLNVLKTKRYILFVGQITKHILVEKVIKYSNSNLIKNFILLKIYKNYKTLILVEIVILVLFG